MRNQPCGRLPDQRGLKKALSPTIANRIKAIADAITMSKPKPTGLLSAGPNAISSRSGVYPAANVSRPALTNLSIATPDQPFVAAVLAALAVIVRG